MHDAYFCKRILLKIWIRNLLVARLAALPLAIVNAVSFRPVVLVTDEMFV